MQFPEGADPRWLVLATKLKKLTALLGYHEAMWPNLDQIDMAAASKNKIYLTVRSMIATYSYLRRLKMTLILDLVGL